MCYYEVVVNTADIISHTRKKRFRGRSCKLIEVDLSFPWLKTVWLSLLVLKLGTNTIDCFHDHINAFDVFSVFPDSPRADCEASTQKLEKVNISKPDCGQAKITVNHPIRLIQGWLIGDKNKAIARTKWVIGEQRFYME